MHSEPFQKIEVIFDYCPFGTLLPGILKDLGNSSMRSGCLSEVTDPFDPHILRLFVTSAAHYKSTILGNRRALKNLKGCQNIGILIAEDSEEKMTIRLKKKIAYHDKTGTTLQVLAWPHSVQDFSRAVSAMAERLYLKSNQTVYLSIAAIRELETRAMHDMGPALKAHGSHMGIARLVLEKCVSVSRADVGFLYLSEQLFEDPVPDGINPKVIGIEGDLLAEKAKLCQSQNISLSKKILNKSKDPLISVISILGRAVAWNEDSGYITAATRSAEISEGLTILESIPGPAFHYDSKKYRIANFCFVPIKVPTGVTIGFIILVNRRNFLDQKLENLNSFSECTREFIPSDLIVLEALTHQAGVSLDHARLIKNMNTVFESFVKASVVAIESRDPSTKGHSVRVATLTVALAEAAHAAKDGPCAGITFTQTQLYELKYASLLHDFGKIGVKEDVLQKENKLYPAELATVRERFLHLERQLYLRCFDNFLEGLMNRAQVPTEEDIRRVKKEITRISRELSHFWTTIMDSNEPQVVKSGSFQMIAEIAAIQVLMNGRETNLLSPSEVERLSLKKGSLSHSERLEIEKHVTNSYNFLLQIPWTSELASLSEIVYTHHERLDGSGYPRGLKSNAIPVQARIMAVCDIYDALVAMDRPYKKAIPHERAMNILEAEMLDGKLEPAFFQLFKEREIYKLILDEDLRVAS